MAAQIRLHILTSVSIAVVRHLLRSDRQRHLEHCPHPEGACGLHPGERISKYAKCILSEFSGVATDEAVSQRLTDMMCLQLLKNLRRSVTTLDICGQWGEKGDEATLVRSRCLLRSRDGSGAHVSGRHTSELHSGRCTKCTCDRMQWLSDLQCQLVNPSVGVHVGDGDQAGVDAGPRPAEAAVDPAGGLQRCRSAVDAVQ